MSNTREDYWDINGTSIETYAWNLHTRGGSLRGTPPPRGENRPVPHRDGRFYLPKYRDSRILQFVMWVLGSEQDGSAPPEGMSKQFDENFAILQDLFDFDGQRTLTKRWYEGLSLKSASALVEYAGGLDPTMHGPRRGDFSPELLLADPWFYEPAVNVVVGDPFTVRGDRPTDNMTISIVGTSPRITIGDRWIQYNGAADTPVTINVRERYAMKDGLYVNGLITRDRLNPTWLELPVGVVDPVLTGVGAYAEITYQAKVR